MELGEHDEAQRGDTKNILTVTPVSEPNFSWIFTLAQGGGVHELEVSKVLASVPGRRGCLFHCTRAGHNRDLTVCF